MAILSEITGVAGVPPTNYVCGAFLVLFFFLVADTVSRPSGSKPPRLASPWVPMIGNTYQYLTDNGKFLKRVSAAAKKTKSDIVRCYLGPVPVYFVKGSKNTQAIFRDSAVFSPDVFLLKVMENLQGIAPSDLAKFASDRSGRLTNPTGPPAADGVRYWTTMHHAMEERFSRKHAVADFGTTFARFFREQLNRQPRDDWAPVHIFDLMRSSMCEAAVTALVGRRVLEREPSFIDALWDYDGATCEIAMAVLPRWLNPKPWKKMNRFHRMAEEFLQQDFDAIKSGQVLDPVWDSVLGSRAFRSTQVWERDIGMSLQTRAGSFIGFMHGLNSNTIAATTWAIMELVKDPSLWKAVRKEASACFTTNPATGEQKVDATAVMSLPLLQSIYIEVLRLHVSFNITREIVADATIAGYKLPKHALVQAPTHLAHLEDSVWGTEGHPASEFWAARHLKFVQKRDEKEITATIAEFSMKGRSSDFFPFGSGASMCPGRHFAKQTILLSVAMIVNSFDVEFVEWTSVDRLRGSERPAEGNQRFSGVATMPPDRDMRIRWKRIL